MDSNKPIIKFCLMDRENHAALRLTSTSCLIMDDLLSLFKSFSLAAGFHPDTVKSIQILDEQELEDLCASRNIEQQDLT